MKKILLFSTFIAFVIASAILLIAIDHNTMEVFCIDSGHQECQFDFRYAAFIWLGWFLPALVVQLVVSSLLLWLVKWARG
jgi:hypothetical protein